VSVCLSVCLYLCVCVCLVITPWSQSTIATHLRDESCVDQEQRHRCSGREHARCPGTDKPPTASAVTEMMFRSGNSRVIAVTVPSVFHLSWFYSYVCNCPVFRHCICTLRYSWPIGRLCSLFFIDWCWMSAIKQLCTLSVHLRWCYSMCLVHIVATIDCFVFLA